MGWTSWLDWVRAERPGRGPIGAAAGTPSCIPIHSAPAGDFTQVCLEAQNFLPEDRGAGAGFPSHTEHTQALGEQHEGQQDPIQERLMGGKEHEW